MWAREDWGERFAAWLIDLYSDLYKDKVDHYKGDVHNLFYPGKIPNSCHWVTDYDLCLTVHRQTRLTNHILLCPVVRSHWSKRSRAGEDQSANKWSRHLVSMKHYVLSRDKAWIHARRFGRGKTSPSHCLRRLFTDIIQRQIPVRICNGYQKSLKRIY